MELVAAILLGGALGLATGLVPGLHVNTLLAVLFALVPHAGDAVALALVATGTVHTFVAIVPATFLGAPDEGTALAVLPAHQMLREGFGLGAVHVATVAGLVAAVASVALALPYKWLLREPGRLLPVLDAATPYVLGALLLMLVASESPRGVRGIAWAVLLIALSGALGWLAMAVPLRALVAVPASSLLPLLAGLFGLPTLLIAASATWPPQQALPNPVRHGAPPGTSRAALLGVGAAMWTAVLPGVSAAVATVAARAGQGGDARSVLATMGAVNTAHAILALQVLYITGRPRTGLAIGLQRMGLDESWQAGLPGNLRAVLLVVLGASVVGAAGTLWIAPRAARVAGRIPARPLHLGAASVVVGLTLVLTGWLGLLLLAAATCLGLVPLSAGIRRVHLAGALLVPVLLSRLGVA